MEVETPKYEADCFITATTSTGVILIGSFHQRK